jgi:hypothetical protein
MAVCVAFQYSLSPAGADQGALTGESILPVRVAYSFMTVEGLMSSST